MQISSGHLFFLKFSQHAMHLKILNHAVLHILKVIIMVGGNILLKDAKGNLLVRKIEM